MIEGNYEKILGKIAGASGLEASEVDRQVEAKRAKLSGLISKEGAAQVVAAELGISFENERLKIDELLPGMRKVNVVGKVINLFPVREFERNGQKNKVVNFFMADETSNVRVVLWDTNHIELIEKNKVIIDSVVEISNASVREGEIHLGSFSEFKLSDEKLENVKTELIVKEKDILDFKIAENVKARAFVVQIFDLRFFEVCPECRKKITKGEDGDSCQEHGKIIPEKRALINLVLDDGSETIRAVFFHDALSNLGFNDLENADAVSQKKQELLGKEMFFSGTVRQNKYFNNSEFIIDKVDDLNLDNLIKELEK